MGHVARANPVWRALAQGGQASVLVFHGPQAYITPGWYPGKATHGRVVPTWNYAVVHAHGVARAIHDTAWKRAMLDRLSQAHESAQAQPWQVSDAQADHIDRMLRAIVGIEVQVDRLEGKFKASQDEGLPGRQGAVVGLRQSDSDTSRAMWAWVAAAVTYENRSWQLRADMRWGPLLCEVDWRVQLCREPPRHSPHATSLPAARLSLSMATIGATRCRSRTVSLMGASSVPSSSSLAGAASLSATACASAASAPGICATVITPCGSTAFPMAASTCSPESLSISRSAVAWDLNR